MSLSILLVFNECLIIKYKKISCTIFSETKKGDNSPETVLALLQTMSAESEESSDQCVTKLTSKESTIEEFLEGSDGFLAKRKQMHLRKLKSEKMIELIQQQKSAARGSVGGGGIGGGGGTPYPNFYGQPAGGVPYPTGPYQMPMPGMPAMPGMMYRHF